MGGIERVDIEEINGRLSQEGCCGTMHSYAIGITTSGHSRLTLYTVGESLTLPRRDCSFPTGLLLIVYTTTLQLEHSFSCAETV
jgi:hypothetical protein